jgi:hypothetical protein
MFVTAVVADWWAFSQRYFDIDNRYLNPHISAQSPNGSPVLLKRSIPSLQSCGQSLRKVTNI